MRDAPRRCWVISDGRRGIENQALGLAGALGAQIGLDITSYHMESGAVFQAATPRLQLAMRPRPEDYGLNGAPADIAIGCGRQAIAPLLAIKKHAPQTKTIYVQDPRIDPAKFDLVVAPEHDDLRGENVITMIGSPNRVSRDKIAGETIEFADRLNGLPMPRAAILIGGTSKTHRLSPQDNGAHIAAAQTLLQAGQCVLVSTSRRTPDFAQASWAKLAAEHDNVWLYEDGDRNPYFAFLGAADMILVTEDSTNMLTEACATGKPVFRLAMSGSPKKFAKLYQQLNTRCGVESWEGQTSGEDYPSLDETARAAKEIIDRFDWRS